MPVAADNPPYASLSEAFQAALEGDGPVNQRLSLFADTLRRLEPDFTGVADRFVSRLSSVQAGQGAPGIGELMPAFVLPDADGGLVALDTLLGRGPVVIALHRGHWCPFCRINSRALAQAHDAVVALGGTSVAITPETAGFAAQLRAVARDRYPVLVDIDNGYALSLNLAVWLDLEFQKWLVNFGVDLNRFQGNQNWMLPIPATFVVGRDGRVKARFIDPDYRRRMEIDDLVKAVGAVAKD